MRTSMVRHFFFSSPIERCTPTSGGSEGIASQREGGQMMFVVGKQVARLVERVVSEVDRPIDGVMMTEPLAGRSMMIYQKDGIILITSLVERVLLDAERGRMF